MDEIATRVRQVVDDRTLTYRQLADGDLVKESDLAALRAGRGVRHDSTMPGAGSIERAHVDERSVKRVTAFEVHPGPAR